MVTAFGIAISLQQYVGYAVVSLTIEINSLFLHARQLLLLLHVTKRNVIYRFNSLLNIGQCCGPSRVTSMRAHTAQAS